MEVIFENTNEDENRDWVNYLLIAGQDYIIMKDKEEKREWVDMIDDFRSLPDGEIYFCMPRGIKEENFNLEDDKADPYIKYGGILSKMSGKQFSKYKHIKRFCRKLMSFHDISDMIEKKEVWMTE